jgi:hypothetical protein
MTENTKSSDLLRAVGLIPTDLDAAHKIAQQYESDPIADTIHAIIHRREGDYGNSIYWWRRVGSYVPTGVATVYPNSDPVAFVRAAEAGAGAEIAEVERAEMDALRAVLSG